MSDCDEVLARANALQESGELLTVDPDESPFLLGTTYAYTPGAAPLDVWVQRTLTAALIANRLWCDELALAVDPDFLPSRWMESPPTSTWLVKSAFVVWRGNEPLYAGILTITARLMEEPQDEYIDDFDYWKASASLVTVAIDRVGPSSGLERDEDWGEETDGGGIDWGCVGAIGCLVILGVLVVIGFGTALDWVLGLLP